jgi:starvation-inducible DNA-binding protein
MNTHELPELMNKVLVNYVRLHQKVQIYHWNVVGRDFYMFHKLFGEVYETIYPKLDELGELIRSHDHIVEFSGDFSSGIEKDLEVNFEFDKIHTPEEMIHDLIKDFLNMVTAFLKIRLLSENDGECHVSAFVDDNVKFFEKYLWVFKSTIQKN